ncbi:MAG: hypothetical protein WBG02_18720 [Candidatus Acidiferrum sp.]
MGANACGLAPSPKQYNGPSTFRRPKNTCAHSDSELALPDTAPFVALPDVEVPAALSGQMYCVGNPSPLWSQHPFGAAGLEVPEELAGAGFLGAGVVCVVTWGSLMGAVERLCARTEAGYVQAIINSRLKGMNSLFFIGLLPSR